MRLGWTTVETRHQAESLARGLVEAGLAACVQIEGPITSCYRWEGQVQTASEFRLTVKYVAEQHLPLEAWLLRHHPYETPEWIVVAADYVAEKYLSWARSTTNSVNL